MTSHVNAEVVAQGRFACRIKSGDFANLIEIKLTDFDGGAGIEVFEIGFDRLETGCAAGQILLVCPSFFENDGNHGFEQKGIRAGADA